MRVEVSLLLNVAASLSNPLWIEGECSTSFIILCSCIHLAFVLVVAFRELCHSRHMYSVLLSATYSCSVGLLRMSTEEECQGQ